MLVFLDPLTLVGIIVAALVLCLAGLVLTCFGVGAWGKRKAERDGRYCKECGLWDEPVEILIHRIQEHEKAGQ